MEIRNGYIFKKQVLSKAKLHCQAKMMTQLVHMHEQHNYVDFCNCLQHNLFY